MSNWKAKFLFLVKKEILLKAFLQAILTYTMGIFLLPKSISTRLNGLFRKFWWGFEDDSNRIHRIECGKLGVSKATEGMGFRDVESFNLALLARQCWRILMNPSSLVSRLMKQKYLCNCDFLQAKLGHNHPMFGEVSLLAETYFLLS